MTLLKAEAGFSQLKGTLGLRPNFHQLEDRVDGHMLMPLRPCYGTLPCKPDDEHKRVYQMLGIDWKSAYPTRKTEIPA